MHYAYLNFITRTTAIALLIVGLQSGYSHGLKCYVCNSAYDEGCAAAQPPMKYLVECTTKTAKPVQFTPPKLPNSTTDDGNADEPSTTSAPAAVSTTANTTTLEQPTNASATPNHESNDSSTSTRREALDDSFLYPVELKDVNFTTCRKHDAAIPQQKNGPIVKEGTRRVYRSCGWMDTINQSVLSPNTNDTSKNACKWASKEGISLQICTCYSDACNSGFRNALSFSSFFFLAILTFVIY